MSTHVFGVMTLRKYTMSKTRTAARRHGICSAGSSVNAL